MRSRNLVFIAICLHGLAVLLAAAALMGVAAGIFYAGLAIREVFDPHYFSEELVDEMVAAGFAEAPTPTGQALLEERRIVVTSSINERTAQHLTEQFLHLDQQDPALPINLFLATSGGWVDCAFVIIDAMEAVQAPVNVHAISGCYSSGTMILCAATGERTATSNAILMVHANMDEGGGAFAREGVSRERFETIYRRCANLPSSWYPMTGDSGYYLSPDQALRYGVIDAIQPARAWRSK